MSPAYDSEMQHVWYYCSKVLPGRTERRKTDKRGSLRPDGGGPRDSDDVDLVHAAPDEVRLVEVRVGQLFGKVVVVGSVVGVAHVEEEGEVAVVASRQGLQLILQPLDRIVVGDVKQGGN